MLNLKPENGIKLSGPSRGCVSASGWTRLDLAAVGRSSCVLVNTDRPQRLHAPKPCQISQNASIAEHASLFHCCKLVLNSVGTDDMEGTGNDVQHATEPNWTTRINKNRHNRRLLLLKRLDDNNYPGVSFKSDSLLVTCAERSQFGDNLERMQTGRVYTSTFLLSRGYF